MASEAGSETEMDLTEAFAVVVGQEKKQYLLHKYFATKTSEFFTSATTNTWREGTEKAIHLPEILPQHFDFYIKWLYTGKLIFAKDLSSLSTATEYRACASARFVILMKLYLMGYYLLDAAFRNVVVAATIETYLKTEIVPGSFHIAIIWNNTPNNCSMKSLITRMWSKAAISCDMLDGLQLGFAKSLIKDMFLAKEGSVELARPSLLRKCDYHEHGGKLPRCT